VSFSPVQEQAPGRARAACSFRFADRLRSPLSVLVRGFVVQGRARFAEYSLAISCVASLIVVRGTNPLTLTSVVDRVRPDGASNRSPSARSSTRTSTGVRKNLRGQHLDPPRSPSCSRGADEIVPIASKSPSDEQVRKCSCCGRRRSALSGCQLESVSSTVRAGSPSRLVLAGRLRRSPHDEAVTCIPWRAPLVAEARVDLCSPSVQARLVRFLRRSAPDGHRPRSSFSRPPVTEDTEWSSRQCRCGLTSRCGSLRCHQMHLGGCGSTNHGATRESGDP
jgi:hypothetical protein